jgi:hypothetical protein
VRTLALAPLLLLSVLSFVYVRSYDGDGGALISRERHAQSLVPSAVDRAVSAVPDPVAEPTHVRGRSAACSPVGTGELLNPWRCSIAYPSGREVEFQVTIAADGSYTGNHEVVHFRGRSHPDTGTITGCCINVP